MNEKTMMNASRLKGLFEEETEFSNLLIHDSLLGAFGSQTTFTDCTFQDCEIRGCFFEGATFINCSFYGCDLKVVDFTDCTFENCTFSSRFDMCDLSTADFKDCAFRRGYFHGCSMNETKFTNVVFDGIWAGKLNIIKPSVLENVLYTMGGARCDEVEQARNRFMFEMGIETYVA